VGHTTRYGSQRRDRKIPRRPPDPNSRVIAAIGALAAVILVSLLVWVRQRPSEPVRPDPTATPRRAEAMARQVEERRQQFLASLTPTPDTDLTAVRSELELRSQDVCSEACPSSTAADCKVRELQLVVREDDTLRVDFAVACGAYQDADGRWIHSSPLVRCTASFDRFGGRWLMASFSRADDRRPPDIEPEAPELTGS
jgi:hypothetical protein